MRSCANGWGCTLSERTLSSVILSTIHSASHVHSARQGHSTLYGKYTCKASWWISLYIPISHYIYLYTCKASWWISLLIYIYTCKASWWISLLMLCSFSAWSGVNFNAEGVTEKKKEGNAYTCILVHMHTHAHRSVHRSKYPHNSHTNHTHKSHTPAHHTCTPHLHTLYIDT